MKDTSFDAQIRKVCGWPNGAVSEKIWLGDVMNMKSLFTEKLIDAGFCFDSIEFIQDLIDGTCNYCWDSKTGCQCWNDE